MCHATLFRSLTPLREQTRKYIISLIKLDKTRRDLKDKTMEDKDLPKSS